MWCLTVAESAARCESTKSLTMTNGHPRRLAAKHVLSVPLSNLSWSRLAWFSKCIAASIGPFDECLLWVTLSGVWRSSENWHLFYRLRESYGERRPLHEAPGHLFLQHEAADLATFIGVALLSGWDFYLLPDMDYASVFVTHDEFLEFYTDGDALAGEFSLSLTAAKVEHRSNVGTSDGRDSSSE